MIEHKNIFIDGQWIPSSGTERLDVVNPATEEVIASIPSGTPQDVEKAANAALSAFTPWSQSTIDERVAIFNRLADITERRSDEITRTIVSEVGQPITSATISQTIGAVDELRLIAELLPKINWEEQVGRAVVRREAAGVVGAITAWNAPLRSIISKAGAAIAAGCTVVLKGSEVAPLTSYIFSEMVAEAGLPKGVFNMVTGTGPIIGEAIVNHPAVDMVSLTGSVRAGKRVMQLASEGVKRVHLELGGKSANIILDDADMQTALEDGIKDAYRNAGQVCGGLTRILVPKHLLKRAEEIAVSQAESFIIGDPFDMATTLGPVTTLAQRDRVRIMIKQANSDGHRMLTGGAEAPKGLDRGWFIRPTVFSCSNNARIAREEVFGPVVAIIPFETDTDAIAIANDSDYGLAGGVWSADAERARNLAKRLRTGRVRINGAPLEKLAPHGGFKLSGIGREWGKYGIEEFLEYQSIIG